MRKPYLILLTLFAFMLLACGGGSNTQQSTLSDEQISTEEKSLVGSWTGIWIQNDVHYNSQLPEVNCEGITYWDPEFHRSEGGVEWSLRFTIDEENNLNIADGGEDKIILQGDKKISFETEWNCNRVVKWTGEISDDFKNMSGRWEIHHPSYNLMSSGNWRVRKY